MKKLRASKVLGFPRLVSHGMVEPSVWYVIMQKYGPSLKCMLKRSQKKRFRIKSVVQIGMQLLDRL